jgi:hypothetical protein
VGMSSKCEYSRYSERISYMTSFDTISMLPFPHRNLINFIGMGEKESYLIWREKAGFFTALHRDGNLRIWSIVSGKFLGCCYLEGIPQLNKGGTKKVESIF